MPSWIVWKHPLARSQQTMTAITLSSTPLWVPVAAADGGCAQLLVQSAAAARCGVLWLPAMGVAARHYAALAAHCAELGLTFAVHEWRGVGSSAVRAGRAHDWGYRELLMDVAASFAAARAQTSSLSWIIGGHSLGGQLALLFAAQGTAPVDGLALIGSGTPYWRNFPWRWRGLSRAAFALAPLLAQVVGHYPGRRLGFAGNEARGVIRDWTRSARSGRYGFDGMRDAESALARLRQPVLVMHAGDDRLVPRAAIDHLLAKMPIAPRMQVRLDAADFGLARVGHFGWMQAPRPVARVLSGWVAQMVSSAPAVPSS